MNIIKNTEMIPAILPRDFDELKKKLILLKNAFLILDEQEGSIGSALMGGANRPLVQIDICDGQFVPTKTWLFTKDDQSISQLAAFANDFDFEIDLMVQNPLDLVKDWQNNEEFNLLNYSGIKRIIIHVESVESEVDNLETWYPSLLGDQVSKLSSCSIQVGVAFNPDTLAEKIIPYLQIADFIQFMGIDEIGYQGQIFSPKMILKIQKFHEQNPRIIISVDGGVNLKNASELIRAGASRLVIGSAIFADANEEIIAERIKKFKYLIN